MANVVGTITGYRQKSSYTGNWGSWVTGGLYDERYVSCGYSTSSSQGYATPVCYRFEVDNDVSGWNAEKIYLKAEGKVRNNSGTANHELTATFYDADPTASSGSGEDGGTLSLPYNQRQYQPITYEADVSSFTGKKIFYVIIELTNVSGINGDNFTPLEVGVSVMPPPLGLTITPDPVDADSEIALRFTNRLAQDIDLTFSANGQQLLTTIAYDDSKSVTCPFNWFAAAGVSGSSMEVIVTAADAYGRTVSGTFTLQLGDLEVTASPGSAGIGDSIGVSVWRHYDARVNVAISCNGTGLDSFVYGYDNSFRVEASWLSTIRDSYATLDITAADTTYNRRGEASVSLSVHALDLTLAKSTVQAGDPDGQSGHIDYLYDEPVRLRVKSGSAVIEDRNPWTSDDFSLSPTLDWFSRVGETGDSMEVTVEVEGQYTGREAYASFSVTRPVLAVTAPSQVTSGGNAALRFEERNGTALTVVLKSGSATLAIFPDISADTLEVTTAHRWFQDAGVTGRSYMTVTVTVTASDGRSAECDFTLNAADAMRPTVDTITLEAVQPTSAMASRFGQTYVQGYTRIKVSVSASALYGASVGSGGFTLAGSLQASLTYNSSSGKWEGVSGNPVTTNGAITVSVTDSRGLTGAGTISFSDLTAYSVPAISELSFHRCRQDRTKDDAGGYCLISAKFTISPVQSKNSKNASIASSVYSDSVALDNYTQTLEWFFAADIEHSYEITLTAIDAITSTALMVRLSTAGVIMDFLAGGKGVAFGKVAEYANTVEISPEWTLKTGAIELDGADLGQLLASIQQRLTNGGL